MWLGNQKRLFANGDLTPDQIDDLRAIGLEFQIKTKEDSWLEKYQLAKAYYEYYGHLKVPRQFKTINGVDIKEDGIALGLWIHNQRRLYQSKKISEERMNLLLEIGMIFSFQQQKEDELQNSSESGTLDDTSKKI